MSARSPRYAHGSVRVGSLLGVEVRLHWTFVGLVALVAWLDAGAGTGAVIGGLSWLGAVFGSVLVHEASHCVVARRRGAIVDDILLTPLGGMSQLHEMPERPDDELAIALVGPLTSLALALASAGACVLLGGRLWPPALFVGSWFARLAWLNVLLGAFNLLPALPMDGGRVLRALLARTRTRRAATVQAARIARALALGMIVIGFGYDVWLVLIGLFVLLGANAEQQAALGRGPDGARRPDGRGSPPPAGETGEPEPPSGACPPSRPEVPPQVGAPR